MNRSDVLSVDRRPTRRGFLAGTGTALLVGGAGQVSAAQEGEVVTPSVIIPTVEEFENNYTGQFLTLRSNSTDAGDLEAVRDACPELPWPADQTQQIEGQLTDRRSNEPIAVRLPVFIDDRQRPEQDDALYVISRVDACGDEYVSLQLSAVDLRNISGGAPGPGASGDGGSGNTDGIGAGPGLLAGAVGGVGAVLARVLSDNDSSTD